MNIIRADFDWTSLLIVVAAGLFGVIKSLGKKKNQEQPIENPYGDEREDSMEEEHEVEWWNNAGKTTVKREEPIQEKADPVWTGDYYKPLDVESPLVSETEEENSRTATAFDIRQAIISSEILRRPEY